jgi:hypothetical protein
MSTIYKTSFLVLLLIVLGFSSCVVNHIGNAGQNIPPLGTNYKILTMASGKASATRFLGIETQNRVALTAEAMQNMFLRYPLSKGQTFAFLNVDSRNSFSFLGNKTTIAVTAFVIEASDSMTSDKDMTLLFNSQNYLKDLNKFPVGSRVFFIEEGRIIEGLISQYTTSGEPIVIYVAPSGKKLKVVSVDALFPSAAASEMTLRNKRISPISVVQDSILRAEERIFIDKKLKEKEALEKIPPFKIGDKVYFQTNKGKILGNVTDVDNERVLVTYKESKSVEKAIWILKTNVMLAEE